MAPNSLLAFACLGQARSDTALVSPPGEVIWGNITHEPGD